MPADDPASALALRYQQGQLELLGALHRAVRPSVERAVSVYLKRFVLPATLEVQDLRQQVWLILAKLAHRWRPEAGSFPAYVASSMPWELERFVRRHLPSHRSARVRVSNLADDALAALLAERAGEDGRDWDKRLVCGEVLAGLEPHEAAILHRHGGERRTYPSIAAELDLEAPKLRGLYRRALRRARKASGARPASAKGGARVPADLVRLVHTLHAEAPDGTVVPGREQLCARAGLSQVRYARLMELLAAAGCIRDRSPRRAGRLAEGDATASLRRVEAHLGTRSAT